MANIPKPIKVLTDLESRQQTTAKSGLIVSGTLRDSQVYNPDVQIGLKVTENVYFDKDLYVADKTYAVGFSQVGALDVNGVLQVTGSITAYGDFELSGASNFLVIDSEAPRNTDGLYFVDDAIHALDEKIYVSVNKINNNKLAFELIPTESDIQEYFSHFPWEHCGYMSVNSLVYIPENGSEPECWTNDLTSIRLQKYIDSDALQKIKFVITCPKTTDPDYIYGTKIRIVATRQTDIVF